MKCASCGCEDGSCEVKDHVCGVTIDEACYERDRLRIETKDLKQQVSDLRRLMSPFETVELALLAQEQLGKEVTKEMRLKEAARQQVRDFKVTLERIAVTPTLMDISKPETIIASMVADAKRCLEFVDKRVQEKPSLTPDEQAESIAQVLQIDRLKKPQ